MLSLTANFRLVYDIKFDGIGYDVVGDYSGYGLALVRNRYDDFPIFFSNFSMRATFFL